MAVSRPVVLILGAGSNIGKSLVARFAGAGYQVVTVSRSVPQSPSLDENNTLSIRADLTDPSAPEAIFETIKNGLGTLPNIVIYNAGHQTPVPNSTNMFSLDVELLERDMALMVASPWAVAVAASKAWEDLDHESGVESAHTFIYTGNGMAKHVLPLADLVTLGASKSAAAYWIQVADVLHKGKGWRFFYADERTSEGRGMGPRPGAESHAEFYLTLAEGKDDLPSYVTFVEGKYVEF